jgi:broad specificity phosphatase PhoE
MKLCSLPEEVNSWRLKLIRKIMEREKNTIIFSHFMVINALIAEFTNNDKLLCFYPDYTSLTKILIKNNEVTELYFGDERKTLINL